MKKIKRGKSKIIKIFTTWRFIFFLLWKLPMGFLARLRVRKLDKEKCYVTVPYNYWNKNPFNSMYFAVQAMAAELSTGALAMLSIDGYNISLIVTNLKSSYYKKATSQITFICQDGEKITSSISKANKDDQAHTCEMVSKGYDDDGDCVSEFVVTWSLKKRKN